MADERALAEVGALSLGELIESRALHAELVVGERGLEHVVADAHLPRGRDQVVVSVAALGLLALERALEDGLELLRVVAARVGLGDGIARGVAARRCLAHEG